MVGILKLIAAVAIFAVVIEIAALTRGTPGPIIQHIVSR